MRLIKYLNEERQLKFDFFKQFEKNDPITKSIKRFEKDTRYWFNYCKKYKVKNKFLWRGGYNNVVKTFMRKKVHDYREPTDTCPEVHELADRYFNKIFNIRARSQTVFCFPSRKSAKNYGLPNILVPIGKFDYIWSKEIVDFFTEIENEDFYMSICDMSYSEDAFEESYDYNYGPDSGHGTWYYENDDTMESEKTDAADIVFQEMVDNGEVDPDEEIEEIEEIKWQIEDKLEWVPEIDYDTFVDEKINNSQNDLYNFIEDNYVKNKYFKELMDLNKYRNHEVMLSCKEYYLINEDWASKYLSEA